MSSVGYSVILNNNALEVSLNSNYDLGHITKQSCAKNFFTPDGKLLIVLNDGIYNLSVEIMGKPLASSNVLIRINVNGITMSAIAALSPATPSTTTYIIRGLFTLISGDIITIANAGTATMSMSGVTNGYNISTIIERYK